MATPETVAVESTHLMQRYAEKPYEGAARMIVINALRKALRPVLAEHISSGNDPILEIGCGTGFLYRKLATPDLKKRLVGIDSSRTSLDCFSEIEPSATLEHGDFRNTRFNDGEFGTVIGSDMHASILEADALIEVGRVLRPGGRLILFQDAAIGADENTVYSEKESKDWEQKVIRYQEGLLNILQKLGFNILLGENPLEASSPVPRTELEARIAAYHKKIGRNNYFTKGGILYGYVRSRGVNCTIYVAPTNPATLLAGVQRKFNISIPLVDKPFKPGKDAFEYARIACIVAERGEQSMVEAFKSSYAAETK